MKKILSKKIIAIFTIILFFNYTFVLSINSKEFYQNVNSNAQRTVNPIGRTIGLKLYTDGALVVGMSEIDGIDGNKHKPYENSGIKEGDMIKSINGKPITNAEELINVVNESNRKRLIYKISKRIRRNLYNYFSDKIIRWKFYVRIMGKRCSGRNRNINIL